MECLFLFMIVAVGAVYMIQAQKKWKEERHQKPADKPEQFANPYLSYNVNKEPSLGEIPVTAEQSREDHCKHVPQSKLIDGASFKVGDVVKVPSWPSYGIGQIKQIENGTLYIEFQGILHTYMLHCYQHPPIIISRANPEKSPKKESEQYLQKESLKRELSLEEKHKLFVNNQGAIYKGTRQSQTKRRRTPNCYNCKKLLDNERDVECNSCGWIICACGACGCGYK